jgi:catechol 2,3-dioxygenase-like lactoylglutathione lyase family enzyme
MPQMQTHISHIGRIILTVGDQDDALRWYTETLGFEVKADVAFGEGDRWLEVGPANGQTAIAIATSPTGAKPDSGNTCVALVVDDVAATHAAFTELGVDVDPPMGGEGPVPAMFFFRDPDGNNLLAVGE